MPTYEYVCPTNQQTVEVQHGMKEKLSTWGELCERAGIPAGNTDVSAPVERILSGGLIATVAGGTRNQMPVLPMSGGCCGRPQSCSHHG